jgi:predicted nucleotidyltransferase
MLFFQAILIFSPQVPIGLFTLAALQRELEEQLNLPVDLITENGLSKLIANNVYNELKVIYGS